MAKGTCSVDGCEHPVRTRTWCSAHYSQWYRSGADPATAGPKIGRPRRRVDVDPCIVDGCESLMRRRGMCERHYASWRRARIRDGSWSPKPAEEATPLTERRCQYCGASFQPRRQSNVYCSSSCKTQYYRANTTKLCSVEACDGRCFSNGMCNKHYKLEVRAPIERRRLPDGGEGAERISRRDIGERDGWLCGICRKPIDPTLVWPHPLSQSLDHIIPVSKAGLHRASNVRITHVTCNVGRGNRPDPTPDPRQGARLVG